MGRVKLERGDPEAEMAVFDRPRVRLVGRRRNGRLVVMLVERSSKTDRMAPLASEEDDHVGMVRVAAAMLRAVCPTAEGPWCFRSTDWRDVWDVFTWAVVERLPAAWSMGAEDIRAFVEREIEAPELLGRAVR